VGVDVSKLVDPNAMQQVRVQVAGVYVLLCKHWGFDLLQSLHCGNNSSCRSTKHCCKHCNGLLLLFGLGECESAVHSKDLAGSWDTDNQATTIDPGADAGIRLHARTSSTASTSPADTAGTTTTTSFSSTAV